MKKPLDSILISHKEFLKFFSFSDKYRNDSDINQIDKRIRFGLTIVLMLNIIHMFIVTIGFLSLVDYTKSNNFYILFLVALSVVSFLYSYIMNRFIFFLGEKVILGKAMNFLESVKPLLDNKYKKITSNLQGNFSSYWFDIFHFLINIQRMFLLLILSLLLDIPINYRLIGALIIVLLFTFLIVFGKLWLKLFTKLEKKIRNEERISKTNKIKRGLYPSIYNLTSLIVYNVLILYVIGINISPLVYLVAQLQSHFSFAWTSVRLKIKLELIKKSFRQLLEGFEKLEKKYIINNRAYKRLCRRVRPCNEENDALILKKFTPMSITNNKKGSDKNYTFSFKPGLYQLRGYNGVGKTTFLKSIALPKKTLVEYSSGQASCFGKPLFDLKDTLEEHRKKYRYLGNGFDASIDDFESEFFTKYPSIYEFLEHYKDNVHTINSEGENSILGICTVYYESKRKKKEINAVFIDEIISRIYSSEDFPLREECIEMVEDLASSSELVVLVVDHAHQLKSATQIVMFEDGIETVKDC